MTTIKRSRKAGERLLQTTVPESLATSIEARALAEGITVAGYLRRLLLRDQADSGEDRVRQVVDHVDLLIREYTQQRVGQDARPSGASALAPEAAEARLVELRQNLYFALCQAVRGKS